jgi:hypothetical protein
MVPATGSGYPAPSSRANPTRCPGQTAQQIIPVLDLLNYLPALLAEASDIASMVKKFFQVSTVNRSSQYVWGISIVCQRASLNWLNAAWPA